MKPVCGSDYDMMQLLSTHAKVYINKKGRRDALYRSQFEENTA